MKKTFSLVLAAMTLLSPVSAINAAEITSFPADPVIGIAWRSDTGSEFLTNVSRAIEEAGGSWVLLDQVTSPDLSYDDQGNLTEGFDESGALDASAAKYVRCNTWYGSNAPDAVGDVSMVIFTGGEDVSPSLYYTPPRNATASKKKLISMQAAMYRTT